MSDIFFIASSMVKLFGFWATLAGATLGGIWILRIGLARALWLFGIGQMVSTLGFVVLAGLPPSLPALAAVIAIESNATNVSGPSPNAQSSQSGGPVMPQACKIARWRSSRGRSNRLEAAVHGFWSRRSWSTRCSAAYSNRMVLGRLS